MKKFLKEQKSLKINRKICLLVIYQNKNNTMNNQNISLGEPLLNSSFLELTFPSLNKIRNARKSHGDHSFRNNNTSILTNHRFDKNLSKRLPAMEKENNKLKSNNISMNSNTSFMLSFDVNLKQQMEHFKFNHLNEILEEDMAPNKKIYDESLDEPLFYKEVPRLDIMNKLLNLLLLDVNYKRFLVFFYVITILIRVFLYFYFHYSLYGDLDFNFIYLTLIYGPRLFYILSMIKVLFQPKTEDVFLERICEGFNYFDNAPQNMWKQQFQYDYKLKLEGYSGKNITKYYQNRTELFFTTLFFALKPIFNRVFLIMFPVEINYWAFSYVFRKKEEKKSLIKKLALVSGWIYQSYEICFLAACCVLMAFNEKIMGQVLSINFTLDTIAFFALVIDVVFFFLLILFLVFTHKENAIKGPMRFF